MRETSGSQRPRARSYCSVPPASARSVALPMQKLCTPTSVASSWPGRRANSCFARRPSLVGRIGGRRAAPQPSAQHAKGRGEHVSIFVFTHPSMRRIRRMRFPVLTLLKGYGRSPRRSLS
eukprot:scaffold64421_cov31-Tisochrysis_lutea.AAC.1